MKIKCELLVNAMTECFRGEITDYIMSGKLDELDLNADKIADTIAINILSEIKTVIESRSNSDTEAIKQIVAIFEKNGMTTGARHS